MAEYCRCGSIKIFSVCSNRRCPGANQKARKWIIDGKEFTFREPLTLEEAKTMVKDKLKLVAVRNE